MYILSIDTSCDDTSVAISNDLNIIANVFWSKIKTHEKWGGVVPNEAKRQHEEFLPHAVDECLKEANRKLDDSFGLTKIDYFAVTYGPGLAVALEPGIKIAKELSRKYNKPLVAVNHMAGHIYAVLARDENNIPLSDLAEFEFPLLALTISGGHTDLIFMKDDLDFKVIGTKLDDALGECIDKVGRILGLPFPAGKYLEEIAIKGNPKSYKLPRPMSGSQDLNFSYSGLKTSVLYMIRKYVEQKHGIKLDDKLKITDLSSYLDESEIQNFASSFQIAAFESLNIKIRLALSKYKVKSLVVGGGVIANQTLRLLIDNICREFKTNFYYPKPFYLCTDNAAMIAIAAFYYIKNNKNVYNYNELDKIDRVPGLSIEKL